MDCCYDVAIIGGGVCGCATLFELTCYGYRCVLLEKNEDLLAEASSGNSGMLHTGFDALENSIELDCIRHCQSRIFPIIDKLSVAVNKIGATIVARTEDEFSRFPSIIEKSNQAGCSEIRQLSVSELHQKEPNLHGDIYGALLIPGEAVTDPWLLPTLLANDAMKKGAKVLLNKRLMSCSRSAGSWDIETTGGRVSAQCVVNCAGLYGDIVDKMAGYSSFRIVPRKGQYTIYEKTARGLINSSIVPVPTDVGKGIIIFRSVYDNVVVGPTAENIDSRRCAPIDNSIAIRLYDVAKRTVKTLETHKVVRLYTGVRPATEFKDYIVHANVDRNWITVGGIRSTGLSGSLGIANMVQQLIQDRLKMEPSLGSCHSLTSPEVTFTKHGTAIIDGREHKITHPLTFVGKHGSLAKL